jgi:hypothetical protein
MFEEPNEQPTEPRADPAAAAQEKSDELRMHAEFAADKTARGVLWYTRKAVAHHANRRSLWSAP